MTNLNELFHSDRNVDVMKCWEGPVGSFDAFHTQSIKFECVAY
jgi:hypothetical protein